MSADACERCGEQLEPGFSACWKCGAGTATTSESASSDDESMAAYANVVLTTAPALDGFRVVRTLHIITAEWVYGVDALFDWLATLPDLGGGRSISSQNLLRSARGACLRELRQEAYSLEANAVIAVDLKYSEFRRAGKSMLLLVATGTAVVVERAGIGPA